MQQGQLQRPVMTSLMPLRKQGQEKHNKCKCIAESHLCTVRSCRFLLASLKWRVLGQKFWNSLSVSTTTSVYYTNSFLFFQLKHFQSLEISSFV